MPTVISASIAHFSIGDPVLFAIDPLLFLGALVTSYVYFNRLNRHAHEPHGVKEPFGEYDPPIREAVNNAC